MGFIIFIIAIIVILGWANTFGSGSSKDYFNEKRRYDFRRDMQRDAERKTEQFMQRYQDEQDEYSRKFRHDNWNR